MIAWSLFIACMLSLGLTPLVRAVAVRWHAVDLPAPRKIHSRPTSLLGGLAVFAATAISVLLLSGAAWEAFPLLFGGALFLLVGLVDDLRNVGAGKLLIEFGVAWLVVEMTGAVFHLPWPPAGAALAIVWVVGMANAFNCLDCADGVATSTGLVAGGAFLVLALLTRQGLGAVFGAAVVGAMLGFLPYNLHPARIFLGDAGSLTLGYFVAMLALLVSPGMLSIPALGAKVVILAIPIYDIIRVHLIRFLKGERTVRGLLTSTGKDHLPHRLMNRGVSPRHVVWIFVAASVTTGAVGVALATVQSLPETILIGLTIVIVVTLLERDWIPGVRRSEALVSVDTANPGG